MFASMQESADAKDCIVVGWWSKLRGFFLVSQCKTARASSPGRAGGVGKSCEGIEDAGHCIGAVALEEDRSWERGSFGKGSKSQGGAAA